MSDSTWPVTSRPPVFAGALWIIGGVAAAVWASEQGKKGKFWWFMGGALAGGAVGSIIDYTTSKQ